MRELSRFDARQVRRLVAMHVYRMVGEDKAANALEPYTVDRELYKAAWELLLTVRGLCT
jgi:hypothetical protein